MSTEEISATGELDGKQALGTDDGSSKFQMPEKFTGKSAEDIAKQYIELEKHLDGKNKSADEIAEIKNSLTELRETLSRKAEDPEEANLEQQHKDYLKKLGVPVDFDLNKIKESVAREYAVTSKVAQLEKDFDGKDGKPKFDRTDISKYALDNGLQNVDPEIVYQTKFHKDLIDWEIKRALKGNRSPSVPEGQKRGIKEGDDDLTKLSPDERKAKILKRTLAELE